MRLAPVFLGSLARRRMATLFSLVASATSSPSPDGMPPRHGPGLVAASAGIAQIAT